jgi:hypothetical protein
VAALTQALSRWRKELSGVGGPNTLLWQVDEPSRTLDLTTAHPGGVSMLLAGRPTRLSDLVRERAAFAEARSRATEIRRRALELRHERGLETLLLVAGIATWDHPGAMTPPQAPVLLRSCTLRPTQLTGVDFDIVLGDEVELNPVLEQYLRSAVGIDVDSVSLAELADIATGFDPYPVYAALAERCGGLPGFTVTPQLVIGTYPRHKLAMVQDLAELASAPAVERLATHTVLLALAESEAKATGAATAAVDGQTQEVGGIPVEASADLDPDPDPSAEGLVLDADSGQGGVVEAALRGRDVLVDAPPGTGTTQTIANLVAALVGQGNSVLFVAEQREEIAAVRERLEEASLGSLLFEAADTLIDHRETVRRIVDRLEAEKSPDLEEDSEVRTSERIPLEDRLRMSRDVLRDHVAALHEHRMPWDVTLYDAQCAIAELSSRNPAPASRVRIKGTVLARLTRERLAEVAVELTKAAQAGAWSTGDVGDPWYGARILSDADASKAAEIVARLAEGEFDSSATTLDGILAESSVPPAKTMNDWRTAVSTMSGVRDTLEVFRPEIFDSPLEEHVAATGTREFRESQGVELGWWTRSRVRRLATKLLRPGRPPDDLHAELVRARNERTAWYALVGAGGRPEISPRLDEAQDAYDAVDEDLSWLGERLKTTAAGGDLHGTPLKQLRPRLAELASRVDRLTVLPHVVPILDDLRAAGMGEVLDDFAARGVSAEDVGAELEHIWWVSLVRHVADTDSRYGAHDGSALRKAAQGYEQADREHLRLAAARTRDAVAERRDSAVEAHRAAAAMLAAEVERDGRPVSLRGAFESASDLLLGVGPCWAMSPLAVAQAVPSGSWFDVVVVADAASVTSAVAVSALSRARQVVAFGNPRGGGPRSFSVGADADSDGLPVEASLFADLSRCLPVHQLRWAHGSRDERLVELVNRAAYGNELITDPAPTATALIQVEMVTGRAAVEPGREAAIDTTEAEVDRVVALVLEHARERRDESLAVVAVTERQADRVRASLEVAAATLDPEADLDVLRFLEASAALPVSVLSIREAAGLSRDVVLLTVGYGKTPHGRVLHRFPALAVPDAERLLAGALMAARRRLLIVSSLAPRDLDESRLPEAGLLLRELLLVAGGAALGGAIAEAGDPLLRDLGVRLRREGLTVAEGVGVGLRPVDLAVTDGARGSGWLVAVESDGPSYASWRGTRERDRLRPEALQRQGWRTVRIWSTDLYRDPAREVARVMAAVRQATGSVEAPSSEDGSGNVDGIDQSGVETVPGTSAEDTASAEAESPSAPEDGPSAPPKPQSAERLPLETGRRRRRGFRRGRGDAAEPARSPAGRRTPAAQTADDTDAGWGEHLNGAVDERWLQEQRPPHWE